MQKRIFAAAAGMMVASHASAQFAMDVTPAEIRKKAGLMALDDLAIEETGIVTFIRFCNENGTLYVDRASILAEDRSEYGTTYRIQRKQGNKVVVEASAGEKAKPVADGLLTMLGTALQIRCERFDLGPDQRFEVISINGAPSAKALIGN